MSGFQAFCSWFEYCKTQLSGICQVLAPEDEKPDSGAYMQFAPGVEESVSTWQVDHMVQARIVVPSTAAEPAFLAGGRKYDQIMDKLRGAGTLDKYNYQANGTPIKTGVFNALITDDTGPLDGDPKLYERIVTFELFTNAGST